MSFFKQIMATLIGIIMAGVLFFIVSIIILTAIISSMSSKDPVKVDKNSILMLSLDKPIVERAAENPFEDFDFEGFDTDNSIGLNNILRAINHAKDNSDVSCIYLKLSTIEAGITSVEEIRKALINFKTSGKPVIAFADVYTQKSYYLASVASKVYMNPEGSLLWTGLNSDVFFIKGTLEKLGIETQIFRHGKYKSAIETFSNDKMSNESREQKVVYMNSIWKNILSDISNARNITVDQLNQYADKMMIKNAADAKQYLLVDSLCYKDELITKLKSYSNQSDEELELISLSKYLKTIDINHSSDNKIALIYAEGQINMDGENDTKNISAAKLSNSIRKARKDSSVKAIVLRVNSPGGSALASDIIWREIKLAAEVKPVISSLGDVAASGGYYIITPSTVIVSSNTTLTGSIGVFGIMVNMKEFLNKKLGITTDNVKTNAHADIFSSVRSLSSEEKMLVQQEIDRVYDTFINRVSEGRKMNFDQVDNLAQGRVWSGEDAIRYGLADTLGDIHTAFAIAAEKAGIRYYTIQEMPDQEHQWMKMLNMLSSKIGMNWFRMEAGDYYHYAMLLENIKHLNGVQMRLPFDINIY